MRRLALPIVAALALTGCSGSSDGDAVTGGTSSAAGKSAAQGSTSSEDTKISGRITVFAAASLRESFTTLEKSFEKANPGTDVVLSFGPSSGLATQIIQGAPADVFASAALKNTEQVAAAGDLSSSTTFARNRLTVVTPGDNPGQITGIESLGESDVKVAICQEQVPCGAVAAKVFEKAGITVEPATEEVDVKAVLTKVQLGEVDAGVVYVTDAKAAGSKVRTIEIPDDQNASTDYHISPINKSSNTAGGKAFVELVTSPEGQKVLAAAGFAPPK